MRTEHNAPLTIQRDDANSRRAHPWVAGACVVLVLSASVAIWIARPSFNATTWLVIGTALTGVALAVLAMLTTPRLVLGGSAIVMFALSSVGRMNNSDGLKRIEQEFQPVIAAVEAYGAEHGRYPEGLDELVPAYLDRVPECSADGSPWYRHGEDEAGSAFSIGCGLWFINSYVYNSREGWFKMD